MVNVQWSSQDNQIKQRRAWLLLGWVTAERYCPCKQPACPAVGGGSEVTFKPLVASKVLSTDWYKPQASKSYKAANCGWLPPRQGSTLRLIGFYSATA
ncbi:hypothetical protein J6590_053896 [Homalodisca vitripennis]|nr:hypothetical protein J6590_053896 [Homalodisca vitripennis]